MKFEKLSTKAVGMSDLPQVMFPEGVYETRLKMVKSKDKKTGKTLRTKKGLDKYLLVWEPRDGKGKPITTVFDNHIDDESNPYVARKFAHMVEAVGYEPDEDEFFYELAEELQEKYVGTVFAVAFKESQDGQSMEVDLFTEEGEPIYELDDTVKGQNKKARAKAEPAEDEGELPEAEEEEEVDDLLAEAEEELDAELSDDGESEDF